MKAEDNCRVRINYSMWLGDGMLIERSPDGEPLEFVIGSESVLPCLERGVMGMETGEVKRFEVDPDEGFGRRDPDSVKVIPREEIDSRIGALEEGMILRISDEEGNKMIVTVASVDDDEVIFDLNHPLAGARLVFEVEMIEVLPSE